MVESQGQEILLGNYGNLSNALTRTAGWAVGPAQLLDRSEHCTGQSCRPNVGRRPQTVVHLVYLVSQQGLDWL